MKKQTKKTLAHFQARYLEVLKPFMATSDIRFYLNGLQVKPHLEGVLICATDGHKLAVVYDKTGFAEKEMIIPVSSEMFSFAKKKFKTAARLHIQTTENESAFEVVQSLVSTKMFLGKKPTATAEVDFDPENPEPRMICFSEIVFLIDGSYPDWKNVIPDVSKLEPVSNNDSFNGKYISAIKNMNAARTTQKPEDNPVSISFCKSRNSLIAVGGEENECFCVLMGMRQDETAVAYPEWLERKAEYPNGLKVLGWRYHSEASAKRPKLHLWLHDGSSCSMGKVFHESACSKYKGANEFIENLKKPYIEADLNDIFFEDDRCCKICLKAAQKLHNSKESIPWPSLKQIKEIQSDQLLASYKEKAKTKKGKTKK